MFELQTVTIWKLRKSHAYEECRRIGDTVVFCLHSQNGKFILIGSVPTRSKIALCVIGQKICLETAKHGHCPRKWIQKNKIGPGSSPPIGLMMMTSRANPIQSRRTIHRKAFWFV
jgi:hypothetical protein